MFEPNRELISVLKKRERYILVITLNLESLTMVRNLTVVEGFYLTVLVQKSEYQNVQGCARPWGWGGGQGNQILVLVKKNMNVKMIREVPMGEGNQISVLVKKLI